jgi:hypothetical protein
MVFSQNFKIVGGPNFQIWERRLESKSEDLGTSLEFPNLDFIARSQI